MLRKSGIGLLVGDEAGRCMVDQDKRYPTRNHSRPPPIRTDDAMYPVGNSKCSEKTPVKPNIVRAHGQHSGATQRLVSAAMPTSP